MRAHRIVILATPGVVPFDVAAALQVFRQVPGRRYRTHVCALEPGTIFTRSGLQLLVAHGLPALLHADTILIPGIEDWRVSVAAPIADALNAAHKRGVRIASICTGAFILAHTGLLANKRATTHWRCAAILAEMFPDVKVDANVLYTDEGNVFTSAGITAGIDLCLHLIRCDYGQSVANVTARRMVANPHRSGGQAQFIDRPIPPDRSRRLDSTREWMMQNLGKALQVSDMAAHAGLATRSFARRFESENGVSPVQWMIEQRVKHAQVLLESTALPVDQVAIQCGFGTALSLRQHFKRVSMVTPTEYRRTFNDASHHAN